MRRGQAFSSAALVLGMLVFCSGCRWAATDESQSASVVGPAGAIPAEENAALDAAFAAAIRAAPGQPAPYEALAAALLREHRLEQAVACLWTAAELDPSRAAPHYQIANIERMRGRLGEAIRSWLRVLELEPRHGRAHARLAAALWHVGDLDGARHHLHRAHELGGAPAEALATLLAEGARGAGRVSGTARGQAPEIAPPVQLDIDGAHGAEVSLAAAGDRVVAAWIDEREPGTTGKWRLGMAWSSNAGASWSTRLLRPPGGPAAADFQADPMTAVAAPDLWVGGIDFLSGGQVYLARWPPLEQEPGAPLTVLDGANDKALVAAGPAPGGASGTLLHVASANGLQTSNDRGVTWTDPIPLGHVGPVPRVDAAGALYIVSWDHEDGIWLWRSLDGGETLAQPRRIATRLDTWGLQDGSRFPGLFRVPPLPSFAVDPAGRLYVVWFDTTQIVGGQSDVDLYLIRSEDQGASWTAPRRIPSAAGSAGDQFFPWIEADSDGRLHLLWYDTRHVSQLDDTPHGMIDVHYAWSENLGDTWTEMRLTAASFDSADAVWQVDGRQFLGDYLGIGVTGERVYLGYATAAAGELDVFVQRIDFGSTNGECEPGPTRLCLGAGRFQVETAWETRAGDRGSGKAVPLTTDTGYFWFFKSTNVEEVVKILNGCGVNGHHWVFAAGLTNVKVVTTITDTQTGAVKTYTNPQGRGFAAVQDTNAFESCK